MPPSIKERYDSARSRVRQAEADIRTASSTAARAAAEVRLERARAAMESLERLIAQRSGDLAIKPQTVRMSAGIRRLG